MAAANPLWRAPRIHGELKLLGIEISERTVFRILRKLPRPPSQTWKTFLHNHLGQMVSTDFFTVPTITMKVLFVFLVLEHRRRQVLPFNVTEHPSAAWGCREWKSSGDHLVKPHPESIEVAPRIDRAIHSPGLFGSHVRVPAMNSGGSGAWRSRGRREAMPKPMSRI
jgi:hypothetical protein